MAAELARRRTPPARSNRRRSDVARIVSSLGEPAAPAGRPTVMRITNSLRALSILAGFALLATACGSGSDPDPISGADVTLPPDTSEPTGGQPPDADLPAGVAFGDVEGTLIGSSNIGGEVVDPQPTEILDILIAESFPEQLVVSFTAGAPECMAANAQAIATDTQVIVMLEVGITTDALTRSCLAGEFEHTISIALTEGLNGREVVAAM